MSIPELDAKVRIFKDTSDRPVELLATAEIVISGAFAIKHIKLLRRRTGGEMFLSFPAERGTGNNPGEWFCLANPITLAARQAALNAVVSAYNVQADLAASREYGEQK